MKIIFDGNEWNIQDSSKNIVEIAKEHGIYIPAPCYYNKSENGCCNGCLILVDGKESRACTTLPADNMDIIYNRDDLIAKRERNLTNFALGITEEMEALAAGSETSGCGDSCSCGDSGCGDDCACGGNCGCGSH